MLYKETVSQTTLELIKELQKDPEFSEFILVGGTSLALQIGHRISIDIDFFTRNDFHAVKSLTYFEDIIPEEWPRMLKEKDLTLEKVKNKLEKEREHYLKTLS